MKLNNSLYDHFESAAATCRIEVISIGLGYTAVTTSDGGIGLAYTYFGSKRSCQLMHGYQDREGCAGTDLLNDILSQDPLQRSVALALVNALNYGTAAGLREDPGNRLIFDQLGIGKSSRIAMVGYFAPLIKKLEALGARLEIMDSSRKIGNKDDFHARLGDWAEVLFLTSTSILNNTCEEILGQCGNQVKTVMLGPSTPMAAEAFAHLPVDILAGTAPMDKDSVMKAVRHGQGTPVIQKYSRKVYLELSRHN